ncbi:MAG: mechanosensitive ion channel family protein [Deltaproteobacteria bacterium]|jgi:moderate conductance mechanosensitive channel|nr:mechanosensitive ion channel family protein [Deltaproteobacteria bacterium]
MFSNLNLDTIVQKIPLVPSAISIGLFFLVGIMNSVLRGYVSKKAKAKVVEDSFLNKFIHEESKFVKRGISALLWIGFLAVIIFIWQDHIQTAFVAIQNIYSHFAKAIIILIIAFILHKISHLMIKLLVGKVTPLAKRKTARGTQRMDTLSHVFKYGSSIIIAMVTSLMLLQAFSIDVGAVLATVGVASVAIGFGAQSLVKDIIGGVFILSEDQYGVGDVVKINGEGGFVEKMTLRITQLRNPEGTLITVPNGSITNVENMTSEWSRIDFKIGVAYDTDLDHALDALMDEASKLKADMPNEIIEDPERLGVDDFGDSAITIRVWIKTAPLRQWMVKRELNRRVHKRFEKEGIEIPFPQRTLWIKEPREALLASLVENKN